MVLEEKTPNLLALLTAYAGGDSSVVLVVPQPPTPTSAQAATAEAAEKKRKKGKVTKGSEEREIT